MTQGVQEQTKERVSVRKVALLGSPNSGKSSLFNQLTGLNQKTGNFAGVTVEKHSGRFSTPKGRIELVDFPGTYSLYPHALDDGVVVHMLMRFAQEGFSHIVLVLDACHLKRSLLVYSQLCDLGFLVVPVLNRIDLAKKFGITIDYTKLNTCLGCAVPHINARTGEGLADLYRAIDHAKAHSLSTLLSFEQLSILHSPALIDTKRQLQLPNAYWAYFYLQLPAHAFQADQQELKKQLDATVEQYQLKPKDMQAKETLCRYRYIENQLKGIIGEPKRKPTNFTERIDKVFTHPLYGYLFFFGGLAFIFQAIYAWSAPLMDAIDGWAVHISYWLAKVLPKGAIGDLIVEGVVPGIGGVVMFVPQIALLFFLIGLLEESGYMARAIALSDRWMRTCGLNGRSLIPMISGMACAIPAVMATRTISNQKERLLTILSVPLVSCSARLPVYAMLIGILFPNNLSWGIIRPQGIVLLALYAIGIVAALTTANLIGRFISKRECSFLLMELPPYQWPALRNVITQTIQKSWAFVWGAGRIILLLSILLWWLSAYGPKRKPFDANQNQSKIELKESYLGHTGKALEPLISPLGYDWKIGIALIASFAAREVFVGTLAIIYQANPEENPETLAQRMAKQTRSDSLTPVFGTATCWSLLIFYVFAMQCISTLGIVQRETRSWIWPLFQVAYMTSLAYAAAWATYQGITYLSS